MIVAIDGPAGTGKSTVAKIIAERLGITFLNSGSFYRAVTLYLIRNNISYENQDEVVKIASGLDLDYVNSHLILNGRTLWMLMPLKFQRSFRSDTLLMKNFGKLRKS